MKNTLYNLVYQVLYQSTKILLPFITIPIISRALGPEGIGIYNYTNSIAQYFVLFAGLGVGVYGNRQIAINRENEITLSKTFWELFTLSFSISFISLISYFIVIGFLDNKIYFYYQSLIIIAAVFDISWFFMGIEDFKKTSLSSMAAQIISFILIILFVKEPQDLGKYIFIQSFNILFSQLIMWAFLTKNIKFVKVTIKDVLSHFVPAISYFMPKVAIVLYTNLNKTILGWMDSKEAVGYYSNTVILNGILVTLITTIDLVLLPKMSNLFSKGKSKEMISILGQSIHIQLFLTIPMMFGINLIAPSVVPWFFGKSFLLLSKSIPLVSPLVIIIPLGMAVGRQYLIPMNKLKIYNLAVMLGAIVSIVMNLILVPKFGLFGALIATILAEVFVTFTRVQSFVKNTDFRFDLLLIVQYLVSGLLMFLVSYGLTNQFPPTIKTTILQIFIGLLVYLSLTTFLKINPLIKIIINKINK